MKFDWYQVTVPEGDVSNAIAECLDEPAFQCCDVEQGRSALGFDHSASLVHEKDVHARFLWGGQVDGGFHAFASGGDSEAFSAFIRRCFPGHLVTRCDVCEDYIEEGAFERARLQMGRCADLHGGMKLQDQGDIWRGQDGRTVRLGSSTSEHIMRAYEKGKQLGEDPNWLRIELQCRAKDRQVRRALGTVTPADIFTITDWSRWMLRWLTDQDWDPVIPKVARRTALETSWAYLVMSYGPTMERMAEKLGGPDAMLQRLRSEVFEGASPDRFK